MSTDTLTVRLKKYNVFSDATIRRAVAVSKTISRYATYQDFFQSMGVGEPQLYVDEKGRGVSYVDVAPRKITHSRSGRTGQTEDPVVMHLPMANPLDPNQRYQVAAMALAFPERRIIAFGNPAGPPYMYRQQNLRLAHWWRVAFTRSKQPLVSAELSYLKSRGVTRAIHLGYSYGALKALIFAEYAPRGSVQSLVLVEPAAHPRGVIQLARDFSRTLDRLNEYVDRSQLQTFLDARKAAEVVHYNRGLRRPVNVAIALMLARTDFIGQLKKVLTHQPIRQVAVAWGTKSELGNDAYLTTQLNELAHDTSKKVVPLRLDGDAHALANDIQLHLAIAIESI